MAFNTAQALQLARDTLDIEAQALLGLKDRLDERFAQAVQLMLNVQGRVVVTGMGKSGHIGRKIAATLASTGTPAMFVHPGEASHGDLGMIKPFELGPHRQHHGATGLGRRLGSGLAGCARLQG